MQPCNRIYRSTVHRRLNMFCAAYRSSSGALTVFAASGLHTHVVTGRSPHAYVNQRLQIRLEHLMMSGMPLETCWAFDERWNDKFYYKAASCSLFLLSYIINVDLNRAFSLFSRMDLASRSTQQDSLKHPYLYIQWHDILSHKIIILTL